MNSINFTNPYLLFIAIPLLLFVVISFFTLIRKRGFNFHTITSLLIHVVICALITLAASGLYITNYSSNGQLIILADVSDSTLDKVDTIDGYINQIYAQSTGKTEICVVTFAKDSEVNTSFNSSFKSVSKSNLNTSATDIAQALTYTNSVFKEDLSKRIILITDAKETDNNAISVASTLKSEGVIIDAIYLNSDNKDLEIQINNVEVNSSAYLNKQEKAKVTIQSNYVTTLEVSLKLDNKLVETKELKTSSGIDYLSFDLDTSKATLNNYSVSISPKYDKYSENNTYLFTQEVKNSLKILVISGNNNEENAAKKIYSGYKDVTYYDDQNKFPNTLDYLCSFDEIVLCNADLMCLSDPKTFVSNLQIAVVDYGKSLNVIGMENNYPAGTYYDSYLNMLPANFDIQASTTALVIIMDASLSMQNNNRLVMAKAGAIQCLDLLDNDDYISVIRFSTDTSVVVPLTRVLDRDTIINKINTITSTRGTNMTTALNAAYEQLKEMNFDSKKVILISDGMPTDKNQKEAVLKLKDIGVTTSVINIQSNEGISFLQGLAEAGNGNYFYVGNTSDLPSIMLNEVDNNINSAFIEQNCKIIVNKSNDSVLANVTELPNIEGFSYAITKYSATNVLSTKFENKATGVIKEAPIYSYWNYGKGKVSLFLSDLGNGWANKWLEDESGLTFLKNILTGSLPTNRVDTPFYIESIQNGHTQTFRMKYEGMDRTIRFDSLTLTSPSNKKIDSSFTLTDGYYQTSFETNETGTYHYVINYSYDGNNYSIDTYFTRSYSKEYNYFDTQDEYLLYSVISSDSELITDLSSFLNEEIKFIEASTELNITFLLLTLLLLIIDIAIRKLRIVDIVDFFKKKKIA